MVKIEQLLNSDGSSVFPVLHESQIKHKASALDVGNIDDLQTTAKESLVVAINENVTNIAYNLQQLGIKTSKSDVENMIALAMADVVKESNIEDVIIASATIIAINDTLVDIKNTKADVGDIPTKVGELTNDKGFITKIQLAEIDIVQKIQSDILDIFETLEGVATKEDISALKLDIPTKLSELENDRDFVAKDDVEYVGIKKSVEDVVSKILSLATKEELNEVAQSIPSKTSELDNDSGFITMEEVPTGNLHQIKEDVETLKLTKAEQDFVAREVQRLDDLIEAIEIPEGTDIRPVMKAIEELRSGKADKSEIPLKVSQLQNDLNYITKGEIDSSEVIVSILENISNLGESVKKTEMTLTQVEATTLENQNKIVALESSELQLQSDLGNLDSSVGGHSVKIAELEKGQANALTDITKNSEQIQLSKNKIQTLEDEIITIPKKTSDLINDSGFINKNTVIGMDLKDNQTIKNMESRKANKTDIPTNISQLGGIDLFQTKSDAIQEYTTIQESISLKANKSDIPTKLSSLTDDIGVATSIEVDSVRDLAEENSVKIQDIGKNKRVFISSGDIPLEDRVDGNLYLNFSKSDSTLEDSVGSKVYLRTNGIARLDRHPTGAEDGVTYILSTNQKMYIMLGGVPREIALLKDVEDKDSVITDIITAVRTDLSRVSDSVEANAVDIAEVDSKILEISKSVGQIEEQSNGLQTILDGQGVDIVTLKERDNTHDAQIFELQMTVRDKANISDIPTKVSQLENDKNYVSTEDILHKYTQKNEPENMHDGDEWHKIID